MSAIIRRLAQVGLAGIACAGLALAQFGSLEGDVKGPDGTPLKGALVKIERKDIKGNYQVKTDKKGHYFHAGLPLGTYRVSVEMEGKQVDMVDNVKTRLGDPLPVDFDLQKIAQRQAATQKAVETGTVTKEMERGMSKEELAALKKRNEEASAQMKKNKELNDAFNAGMAAKDAKQYDQAVEQFNKAATMDATQAVIFQQMAESYVALAKTKTGTEQQAPLDKGLEAFSKALELKPDDASTHNNYALALATAKKYPEMQGELAKAAQLDPAGAGRYYYNLGAVLTNNGQSEAAIEAFKKAIDSDPNYADAQFQYGISLLAKATTTPDGKIVAPPGAKEAFEKYLALKPDGGKAEEAKNMLTTLGATIQNTYKNPDAKAPAAPVRKKK